MTKITNNAPAHKLGDHPDNKEDRGAHYAYLIAEALGTALETQRKDWNNDADDRFREQFEELVYEQLRNTDSLDEMQKLLQGYQGMGVVKNDPVLANFLQSQLDAVKSGFDQDDRNKYNNWEQKVESGGTKHTRTWFGPFGMSSHTTWYTKSHCQGEANDYKNAYEQKEQASAKMQANLSGEHSNAAKAKISANFQKLQNFLTTERNDAYIISELFQEGGN